MLFRYFTASTPLDQRKAPPPRSTASAEPRAARRGFSSGVVALTMAGALLAGCGGGDDTLPTDDGLAPPPPGEGMQYRMVSDLQPSQELERCQFFMAPPEGLNINRQEIRYTAGSHHVLLFSTPYEDIPADAPQGDFVCDGFGDWDVDGLVAGAQSPTSAFIENLPSDVAIRVPPNAVLLMNTHYLNASAEVLTADARINLYTIADEEVKEEAGVIFWYNFFAYLPAQSSASTRLACPITQDIKLLDAQSHMHARGVDYRAWLGDAPFSDPGEELYTNTEWDNVPVRQWDGGGKPLSNGSWISWECDYDNPGSDVIAQGGKTTDEMCMFVGTYYPRDVNMELCSDNGIDDWMLSSEAMGYGTTSCGETLNCIAEHDILSTEYQRCLYDSCPAAAAEVTNLIKCHVTNAFGACDETCDTGDCTACLLSECSDIIDACMTAPTCG